MAEIRNGCVVLGRRESPSPLRPSPSTEDVKDLGAGVVGAASGSVRTRQPAVVRAMQMGGLWVRRPSYLALGSFSPRPGRGVGRFSCEEEGHHFLDACFLCKKPLGGHRDIFMYRGDTPFCSEECRQEQIDMDEDKEKNWTNRAMKAAASRKEQKANAAQAIHVRAAGTIVAG